MVVTGSRLHAVRYYQEFQHYIKKMGYENELGILIAFSGTVHDGGEEYTEVSLNGIKESELPENSTTASTRYFWLRKNTKLVLMSRCCTPCL